MSETETIVQPSEPDQETIRNEVLLEQLKVRFEAADQLRRGVCLLNAGQYEAAEATFKRAADAGCLDQSLPSYLAACLIGRGEPDAAADQFAGVTDEDGAETTACIRHALALWSAGKCEEAIRSLREGTRVNPECAELHFQLGTLLTMLEEYDEAELRFTQAVNINPDHTEAQVSLAMCYGARNAPSEAVAQLQRAQAKRPHDARIGLLLARAAGAVKQQGGTVRVRSDMPVGDLICDDRGIEELSRVIESEPDFVDAFLALPAGQVDGHVFVSLLETLKAVLVRRPEHAELHHHRGRVLERLGRCEDAINENERALQIDPTYTRALIELGRLYQRTDRAADATTRLEQAIAAGAEYADVYFLLGNLYRDQGQITRARSAYRRALVLNDHYEAASAALQALPVA